MTDDAQRAAEARRRKLVFEITNEAKKLKEKGSGAMYAEDEARMLAQATLDLLIRYLELDHAG